MSKTITVFEHQTIKLNQVIGKVEVDSNLLHALQSYSGEKGVPYFSLIHNGIKFNEYVGVIQVGSTIIEVLPKADNSISSNADEEKTTTKWRSILIGMLRAINEIDIFATSNSSLKIKENSVLYLYFEIFIKEVEYLLHAGLVKKYRKKDGNLTTMKGKLLFGKNIQHNLVHHERFYVSYPTYDTEHQLHLILYKTILLIKNLNSNMELKSRIGSLLLHFPEMPNIKVSASIFEKLIFNRKTQSYKKAIDIAKLLLLNFHPDVVNGKNDVLALMFDMNILWEKFVFKSLGKFKNQNTIVKEQVKKYFWKANTGVRTKIIPDIVINIIRVLGS